jgi:hypothetical protein
MTDATYRGRPHEEKIRIDAVILAALKNDTPQGLTRTMRERLVGGAEKSWLHEKMDGLLGTNGPDTPADFERGQAFLNRLRDTLAALPMNGEGKAIPELAGEIKNPARSQDVQRLAFKAIISAMIKPVEPGKSLEVPPIDFGDARGIDKKLVYQGNVDDLPMVTMALKQFRATEAVAYCREKAKNAPSECPPIVHAKGIGR